MKNSIRFILFASPSIIILIFFGMLFFVQNSFAEVSCDQAGADSATCIPTGFSTSVGGTGANLDDWTKNSTGGSETGSTNTQVDDWTKNSTGGNINNGAGNTNSGAGNTNPGDTGKLVNPIGSKSIEEFILKIIDVLLVFATPIIMLYIMYAGYLFVTARGDSGQISTARSALLWAVVGGVIVLGARVIIAVIQGTIKAF